MIDPVYSTNHVGASVRTCPAEQRSTFIKLGSPVHSPRELPSFARPGRWDTCPYANLLTLEPDRLPVVPPITGAQARSPFWVNHDAFSVAPLAFRLHPVAHSLKRLDDLGSESLLHPRDIRQPLMMKAWRVHRLLNVHAIVDHSHQDVGHGGNNPRAARRA